MLFLTACNEESLLDDALSPYNTGDFNCIYHDCISEVNPLLLETSSFDKNSVPLEGLQRAFDKEFGAAQDQRNFDLDGYPSWNHLFSIHITDSFAQYLVPVFKAEDDRVKALILFTHYLDYGVVDVEYIYRDRVKSYPAYNSLRLAGKNGTTPLRDHTSESLVVKFSALDQSLFGNTYDDLLSLLGEETRSQFYNKDCKITTNYLILNCQDVTGEIDGASVLLYTDCTSAGVETVVTVVAGCGGGTNPGGPTGPSGPTVGGGGTGGGVNVVNNDPNSRDNRCLEDGVDCDEDDEDEDEDEIKPDTTLSPLIVTCPDFPGYIRLKPTNASTLDCVFNKFTGADNNVLCDFTSRFFGESTSDLIISSDLPTHDPANARTGVISGTNDIRIRFNVEYVNGNCEVQIMKTLLHELIHAEFRALEIDPSIDNSNFYELYNSYRETRGWDHNVMASFYRGRIESALFDIYGNSYTSEEYEALAWSGLSEYIYEPINGDPFPVAISDAWTALTQERRTELINIQDGLINNCRDESCD
jgi:hypothetical protein